MHTAPGPAHRVHTSGRLVHHRKGSPDRVRGLGHVGRARAPREAGGALGLGVQAAEGADAGRLAAALHPVLGPGPWLQWPVFMKDAMAASRSIVPTPV